MRKMKAISHLDRHNTIDKGPDNVNHTTSIAEIVVIDHKVKSNSNIINWINDWNVAKNDCYG